LDPEKVEARATVSPLAVGSSSPGLLLHFLHWTFPTQVDKTSAIFARLPLSPSFPSSFRWLPERTVCRSFSNPQSFSPVPSPLAADDKQLLIPSASAFCNPASIHHRSFGFLH
jgi:hypothetical protein